MSSSIGIIHGCGTMDTEELSIAKVNYKLCEFSIVQRLGAPHPHTAEGSTVIIDLQSISP